MKNGVPAELKFLSPILLSVIYPVNGRFHITP